MSDYLKKLRSDLRILEVMAEGMASYLRRDALFGPTQGTMPKLTLGGFLMRQHRLTELRGLLDESEQSRLENALYQFSRDLEETVVRTEEKGAQEYQARMRQWEETIRDIRREGKSQLPYYPTAVEPRVMLTHLHELLTTPPYQLDPQLPERLSKLDGAVSAMWKLGDFVWAEEWEAAYDPKTFWYLYGRPAG